MSYQFSYSFDERVCGPVAMYEPVDPSLCAYTPHKSAAKACYGCDLPNRLEREYDWDDSYQL